MASGSSRNYSRFSPSLPRETREPATQTVSDPLSISLVWFSRRNVWNLCRKRRANLVDCGISRFARAPPLSRWKELRWKSYNALSNKVYGIAGRASSGLYRRIARRLRRVRGFPGKICRGGILRGSRRRRRKRSSSSSRSRGGRRMPSRRERISREKKPSTSFHPRAPSAPRLGAFRLSRLFQTSAM